MSMLIAALMFIPLLAMAFAHLLWTVGLTWPIRTEKLLAQSVVGTAGVERMPPKRRSLAIAIGTVAAGVIALALADPEGGGLAISLIGFLCGAVFLGRGAAGYTARFIAHTPDPIFRYNDRRVYSPLCLALGVGFVVLVILRLL